MHIMPPLGGIEEMHELKFKITEFVCFFDDLS